MKRILLILLFSLLFSCQEKFNPSEFKGTWISLDSNESFKEILPTFTFKNDAVYLEDVYTYGIKGKYKLINNEIRLYLRKDTLKYILKYNSKDSSICIQGNKYYNYPGFTLESNFLDYELLNLNREKNITSDSLSKFDNGIHLFKDSKNSLKLKLNDKITSDFELIPRFVIGLHRYETFGSVIYVDEKLTVKDLMKCYIKLWQVNKKSNLLITGFDVKTNTYSGFRDRIDFWLDQANLYSKEKYEPIKPIMLSRNQYLKKVRSKIIEINSLKDFIELEITNKENNYLIQINTDMSIESYILLKEKISEIKKNKKIRIKTEYSLFLPNP